MLERRLERGADEVELREVVDRATLLEMQRAIEDVHVDESIGRYVVELVAATRDEPERLGRREPAGLARARRSSRAAAPRSRPGLRHARRRQERRRPGARRTGSCSGRSSGCSGGAARTSCARSSTRCRTPATEGVDAEPRDGVTRSADPRLARLRGVRRGRARRGPRAPAGRARRDRRAVRRPRRARGHARAHPISARGSSSTGNARSRTTSSSATVTVAIRVRRRPARGRRSSSPRDRGRRRPESGRCSDLAPGEERELPLRLALHALVVRPDRPPPAPRARPHRPRPPRVPRRPPAAAQDLSPARAPAATRRRPAHTQAATGSQVARAARRGPRVRRHAPFVAGDLVSSVNWRATARRGTLVVNERHPERNADVVIFLDSFAEAREADEGTLEHAVRAAATLASRLPRAA